MTKDPHFSEHHQKDRVCSNRVTQEHNQDHASECSSVFLALHSWPNCAVGLSSKSESVKVKNVIRNQ